ncbi:DUF4145 domain-containing protein [Bacillus sp. SH7-1]|uniref:DUF4145 domain-containing protein n=1 Tax=Bacillus sp. SH7-1 TaxID=2217818 RepID=UPI0011CB36CB|nr:DUF4145 domain-containing protein [Bacillus sp. SH7-1]TXR94743.1 DUF4145 domain-containing protein [Bacillus sp. SH7-1]
MKSISFEIPKKFINSISAKPGSEYPYYWHINIPLLPAFSVTHFSIQVDAQVTFSTRNDRIQGDYLIVESESSSRVLNSILRENENVIVVLYYHGIREYSLLFPWITDIALRDRIGLFYEEADKSFETESWLSLALMCGGVFEGMLYGLLQPSTNNHTFSKMLNLAKESGILTNNQFAIMDRIRELRNLVHGNKYNSSYISRREAMDIRATLDQIIKDVSLLKSTVSS